MAQDIYSQMRQEIASLWKILQHSSGHRLLDRKSEIHRKLSVVNGFATKIGGRIQRDFDQLKLDIDRFLLGELTTAEITRMFQDVLKIEQDTREL